MQFARTTGAAGLFLLLSATAPMYAQPDKQGEKQGNAEKQKGESAARQPAQRQQTQRQQAQPQQRQQPQQAQRQQAPQQQQRMQSPQMQRQQANQQQQRQQPQQVQRQQAVAWQQQRGWLAQGAWQGNTTWQLGRAQQWDREHRGWDQRGGYGGYYIPQSIFSLSFGRQHWFRISSRPTMYMGYPRFQYGGFSFLLLDPWPEYWQENWYQNDQVYVDYDDGYYLYNRRYPNVRLAITVAM